MSSTQMLMISAALFLVSFYIIFKAVLKERLFPNSHHLPPGRLGWPVIGESLVFFRTSVAGQHHRFIRERMERYDPQVFKTSILGESMIVFCGPAGNKFLFRNEGRLVNVWWPSSVKKLLKWSLISVVGDEAKRIKSLLLTFLDPHALKRSIEMMDLATQQHINKYWQGKEEVKVHPTVKIYAFELACRLFISMEDPACISKLAAQFDVFLKGIISFPVNIRGTRFYSASKAASEIKRELRLIARQRRAALEQEIVDSNSPCCSTDDLLSHLLVTPDASGKFLSEIEIVDNIMMLLFAGHDTTTSLVTCVMKYLAELPLVYQRVLREQIEIAKSKEPGGDQLLKWEDIQKMRYTWNVVSEVMRLLPPVRGGFREAKVDFTYAGYTVPKGSKLSWNSGSTHMDPVLFPKAEEFDGGRFEGEGPAPYSYVAFGGGPRMCLGNEYARSQILVFLHNVVKRFKWELLASDEKISYDPMPVPSQGLPVHLLSHQSSS